MTQKNMDPLEDEISVAREKSMELDMMRLDGVIFNQILGGFELTKELENLRTTMKKHNIKGFSFVIRNHPSLWHWSTRFNFYELVFKNTH